MKRKKRVERIYEALLEADDGRGLTAQDLAVRLGLCRANVSHELNQLWKEGRVVKREGRPVRYTAAVHGTPPVRGETALDRLARTNPSLAGAIEQAKAAILYPPRGMHTLILGETGVGKTAFAGLMHGYAIETGKRSSSAPFVTFNCADYAHNPQLLLSQLFGVKKGAYTGAESDRRGLLEEADGGFLFLDEVHRLPPEGQEMLFTFMDKGTYRRLGEAEERAADVLIILATTECPDSHLLAAFTRRIPMTIRIPSLRERGYRERLGLIFRFFREESHRLGRDIHVSANAVRAFLVYPCPNNIGQLKTDIQLACARAYADFITGKKRLVEVAAADLPGGVSDGLLLAKEHRAVLEELVGSGKPYYLFSPDQTESAFLERDQEGRGGVYEHIEKRVEMLRAQGASNEEIEADVEHWFARYLRAVRRSHPSSDWSTLIDPKIRTLAASVVARAETVLGRSLPRQLLFSLALHLQTLAERTKRGKQVVHPHLQKLAAKYPEAFRAAVECVRLIEQELGVSLALDEAGFLTMFFAWEEPEAEEGADTVGVLVMTHGSGGAAAMADVTNRLLGVTYARAIDVPLEMEPREALERAKEMARQMNPKAGLLLLVDMGSLASFGPLIEKDVGIPVKVVSLVSTPHVIEATRKALLGHSLAEIHRDVRNLAPFDPDESIDGGTEDTRQKAVIVTACMTGEGSALAIKSMLKRHLRCDERFIEIVPINIVDPEEMSVRIQELKREHRVLCVVSPFPVDQAIPHYRLEDVLHLTAIREIQRKIDLEETYRHMGATLRNHLQHVDGERLVPDVRAFLDRLQQAVGRSLDEEELVGVTLHVCCLVERQLAGHADAVAFPRKAEFLQGRRELYQTVGAALRPLAEKYGIAPGEDEICYLIQFFEKTETQMA